MKNVNLIFWVKTISLVANFGSTGSASTSVDHKEKIKLFDPTPSGLKIEIKNYRNSLSKLTKNLFTEMHSSLSSI